MNSINYGNKYSSIMYGIDTSKNNRMTSIFPTEPYNVTSSNETLEKIIDSNILQNGYDLYAKKENPFFNTSLIEYPFFKARMF